MENAKNKIIELLKSMAGDFSEMSFKYGYDSSSDQHIVEVLPNSAYNSESYMEAEAKFIFEFTTLYPYESVLFVSDDKFISVKEVLFEIKSEIKIKYNEIVQQLLSGIDSAYLIAAISDKYNFQYPLNVNFAETPSNNILIIPAEFIKVGEESYCLAA